MNRNETLRSPEHLNSSREEGKAEAARLDPRDVERIVVERVSMFESMKGTLSPLMQRAIELKLEAEQDAFAALIKDEQKAEEEQKRRRGVLDTRFFKKRPLPVTH